MKKPSISPELAECIRSCTHCHIVCLNMATGHCLEMGAAHREPEHIRTMLVCAEICRTAAYAMIMESSLHRQICAVCADICDACMSSCQGLDEMDECITACARCKASCESMTTA